jgi:hypothetical protein
MYSSSFTGPLPSNEVEEYTYRETGRHDSGFQELLGGGGTQTHRQQVISWVSFYIFNKESMLMKDKKFAEGSRKVFKCIC